MAAVHHVDSMAAEEDMPIMAMQAMTLQFNTLFNVPAYQRWLMAQTRWLLNRRTCAH